MELVRTDIYKEGEEGLADFGGGMFDEIQNDEEGGYGCSIQ